jgi:hypothetical protein
VTPTPQHFSPRLVFKLVRPSESQLPETVPRQETHRAPAGSTTPAPQLRRGLLGLEGNVTVRGIIQVTEEE